MSGFDKETMCNAGDTDGNRTLVLGVVGHRSQTCRTPKKSAPCPSIETVTPSTDSYLTLKLTNASRRRLFNIQ